jgi:DNA-binding response OmpR family regulator
MALILVVADKPKVSSLLREILAQQGHQVLTASTVSSGLELFEQRAPRVSFVDLGMSDNAGIAWIKDIRGRDRQTTIIAVTGKESRTQEHQARQLGVTEFVMTGDKEELTSRVSGVIQKSDVSAPASGAKESILIVDDEPMIVRLLSQFLALRGYHVRTAQNGREALSLVEDSAPELLVLDLYMPIMNGVELLRELKIRGFLGAVVVLTGSHDQELLRQTLELGSVDVLGKPVDLERLALVVEVALALAA